MDEDEEEGGFDFDEFARDNFLTDLSDFVKF